MTLTLMYATDLFDQIENVIIPAMHSGFVVLADRYIYTLIARAAVRGIGRPYLDGIYELALRPDLTFWLDIPPKVSFEREFQKAQVISYWESGRDLNLAPDLYESFVRYQELIRAEFGRLVPDHDFIAVDAEQPVPKVNETLRRHIGELLKVRGRRYRPSQALLPLWH
jgi:dTMP kinase